MARTRKKAGIIATGLAALAGLGLMPSKAQAQVSGNVEYIQSEVDAASYPRFNAFYSTPGDVKGYTFMEFYKGGDGYFGKSIFSKEIGKGLELRTELNHVNEPLTKTGVGLQRAVPGLPENVFLKLGVLPLWFGNEGKAFGDNTIAQYFVSLTGLPLGLSADSFGQINLNTGEWGYGEVGVGRDVGPVTVRYNPALLNKGGAVPEVQQRVSLGVKF